MSNLPEWYYQEFGGHRWMRKTEDRAGKPTRKPYWLCRYCGVNSTCAPHERRKRVAAARRVKWVCIDRQAALFNELVRKAGFGLAWTDSRFWPMPLLPRPGWRERNQRRSS